MKLKKILATVLTLALMASAAVCIPFTASAEYSGTKYTFGKFYGEYNNKTALSGHSWQQKTDSDGSVYLNYTTPKEGLSLSQQSILVSVCPWGYPNNANDKVGFTLGRTYSIAIEYRYLQTNKDWANLDIGVTLLNDGVVANYNKEYNQKLFTLAGWQANANSSWKTETHSFKVPNSFEGDAATSNFGIYFAVQSDSNCWDTQMSFDIKSVTITPEPEHDDMTIDFSNHQTKASADDYGSNCVVQNTPFSNWTSVTEESGNKYLKLEKTGTAQDFKAGQWPYEADDGFNLICNQAGNVGWYGYEAPLKDAFVLKKDTKYFITLRYKLKFTDDETGTVPVKMLHTGKLNTASQALCECGIENSGVTLSETDEWKTIAFSATNKCIDSEDWNCFGLGFYDETVIDRNFELCVDEVTISSTDPLYGDADGNNAIDIRDLVRVKRYSAGVTAEINEKRADLNFDGAIDSADLTLLRRQLIG